MPFSYSLEFLQTKKMIFSSIFDDFSFGQKNLIPQRKSLVRKMKDFYFDLMFSSLVQTVLIVNLFLCSTLKHTTRLVLEGMIYKVALLVPKMF